LKNEKNNFGNGDTMKSHLPQKWYFAIPHNLDLDKLCEENNLNKHIDRLKYIINLLVQKTNLDVRYENEQKYINLNFKFLGKVVNQNNVKPLITFLLEKGIIETDNQYITGKKSKGYALTKEYSRREYIEEKVTNKFILKQLNKIFTEEKRKIESDPILSTIEKMMKRVYINPDVKYYLKSLIGKTHPKYKNKKFKKNDFYKYCYKYRQFLKHNWFNVKDEKTGRLFNTINNMPKIIREFMFVDGKPLEEIDVGNMQPLGLVILIDEFLKNPTKRIKESYDEEQYLLKKSGLNPYSSIREMMDLKFTKNSKFLEEFEMYKYLVFNNKLYDFLRGKYEKYFGTEISKAKLKQRFFTFILFGNFNQYAPIDIIELFRSLFPTIWSIIYDIKVENGHKYASLKLQKIEADIIINKVFTKYIQDHPKAFLLPIHDAILTTPEHSDILIERIKEELLKIGLSSKVEKKSKNHLYHKLNNKIIIKSKLINNIKSIINQTNNNYNKYLSITTYHTTIYKLTTSFMNIIFKSCNSSNRFYIDFRNLRI
jgi:hypothetical protein